MNNDETSTIIIKKKNNKGHGGHHSSSWKIALADFAVAMMAFFLLMWIITTASDAEKRSIAGYFQTPDAPFSGQVPIMLPNMNPLTSPEKTSSSEVGQSALESFLKNEQEKLGISNEDITKMVEEIENSVITGELEIEVSTDRIIIRIMETNSFPSGSAELCPDFIPILKKVAKLLRVTPGRVTISGYTDNVPIYTAVFRSNRELSAVRAVSVAEELLKDSRIDSSRFVIRGYGENNPIASNDTSKGRTKNRRVELEILQGTEPLVKGQVITIEKDADTKLLPSIDKIETDVESVFPPVTDIEFDGYGKYLEEGELGVFDKDALYNYELDDVVIQPKEELKDTLKLEDTEEINKPDDLGIFEKKADENKEKKVPNDLGIFKEKDNSKQQSFDKDDLKLFKTNDNDLETKKKIDDDLGVFKEEAIESKKKNAVDDLGVFKEPENKQKQNTVKDDLGIFQGKEADSKQSKEPDELGVFEGKGSQEYKDPQELGILKKAKPKEPAIELEPDVVDGLHH